jgi:phospholipase C
MSSLLHRGRLAAAGLAVTGSLLGVAAVSSGAPRHSAAQNRSHHRRSHHRRSHGRRRPRQSAAPTATPIRHLVVIFDENVSFDHYFGTYPQALNPPGEPAFHASSQTPTVNGYDYALLHDNPNLSNPQRLDRTQALTCDQDHGYTPEQDAFDHGLMDRFVQFTNNKTDDTVASCTGKASGTSPNYTVMDYYDGNTVTALWNYAQRFAMSDNAFGSAFGPSSPGAIELAAGNTFGAICGPASATYHDSPCSAPPGLNAADPAASDITVTAKSASDPAGTIPVADQPPAGPGTDYSDDDPTYDICSYTPAADGGDGDTPAQTITMGGNNIGEELDRAGITWGWFQGGFSDGYVPGHGRPPSVPALCSESHRNIGGDDVVDYIPHHDPFQFWASTANPMHLPPSSVAMIGRSDRANHQYGLGDFWAAADSGRLPAVSFLKAPGYEDGHPGYSDPLDEQHWLASVIDRLQKLPTWRSTAVIINYDDSDGWYDQVMSPILVQSQTPLDTLSDPGQCGDNPAKVPTSSSGAPEEARCGMGPRLPFMVISPWAKVNYVDNQIIDQSSIPAFIEYNWHLPRIGDGSTDAIAGSIDAMFDFAHPHMARLLLDPISGERVGRVNPAWGVYAGAGTGGFARHDVSAKVVATRTDRAVVTLHPEGSWWPERLSSAQQGTGAGGPGAS